MQNVNMHNASARRRVQGQGMTEYIIIVALIAIAAVAAVGAFGGAVQSNFKALGAELTGTDGNAAIAEGAAVVDPVVVKPGELGKY